MPRSSSGDVLFGKGLEEDHATNLEDVQVVEGRPYGFAIYSGGKRAVYIKFEMLPASKDMHRGGINFLHNPHAGSSNLGSGHVAKGDRVCH